MFYLNISLSQRIAIATKALCKNETFSVITCGQVKLITTYKAASVLNSVSGKHKFVCLCTKTFSLLQSQIVDKKEKSGRFCLETSLIAP